MRNLIFYYFIFCLITFFKTLSYAKQNPPPSEDKYKLTTCREEDNKSTYLILINPVLKKAIVNFDQSSYFCELIDFNIKRGVYHLTCQPPKGSTFNHTYTFYERSFSRKAWLQGKVPIFDHQVHYEYFVREMEALCETLDLKNNKNFQEMKKLIELEDLSPEISGMNSVKAEENTSADQSKGFENNTEKTDKVYLKYLNFMDNNKDLFFLLDKNNNESLRNNLGFSLVSLILLNLLSKNQIGLALSSQLHSFFPSLSLASIDYCTGLSSQKLRDIISKKIQATPYQKKCIKILGKQAYIQKFQEHFFYDFPFEI